MLRAVDLGRLGEDAGAPVAHQDVAGGAQRRIGGDARIGVRAAALQRQRDLRGGDRLTLRRVGLGQHLADHGLGPLDGLPRAAGALHRHGAEVRPALDLIGVEQEIDLIDLAAQADHQHAGEIGMAGIAPERALQGGEAVAAIGHAAAGAMGQRDDAIDIAIGRQLVPREGLGDVVADRGRAVDGREHADEVARACPAALAQEALEARPLVLGDEGRGLDVGAEGIVAGEVPHLDVVGVDVLAGRDVGAGEADDLVVLAHRLAGPDRPGRDLVAGGDPRAAGEILGRDGGIGQKVDPRRDHVVVRVQADGDGLMLGH